jgi:hypothetical protein
MVNFKILIIYTRYEAMNYTSDVFYGEKDRNVFKNIYGIYLRLLPLPLYDKTPVRL